MNTLLRTAQLCSRQLISKSTARNVSKTPSLKSSAAMKEVQKQMQVEDGVPVHLKGGFKDKVLYQLTVLLLIAGLGNSGYVLYTLSYPKKE